MALPAGFSIGWGEPARRKQKRINESCGRENRRRIDHTYQKGDKVLVKVPKKILRKLEKPRRGPLTAAETMAMALWLCKRVLVSLTILM